jgi:hypothetical protein
MITFVLCGLWMNHTGLDPLSAFAAVAASINTLGPGLGEVAYRFQGVSDQGKLVAVSAMLLGRQGIFSSRRCRPDPAPPRRSVGQSGSSDYRHARPQTKTGPEGPMCKHDCASVRGHP